MDFDQEKTLDLATKIIKEQSFHLSKAIENNNLRQCLKETAVMLAELKTGSLSPRNYYALFSLILDELYYLESFFKEEHRRGRKMKHLYDSVQQAQNIIPRIYLMITAGRVYIDSNEIKINDIIFELLNSIKGVQNPTRGLFLRYYLLKMIKDKLPDTKEELDVSIKFILQNLEEMNRLWIRLSTGVSGNEKLLREKERNELKVLVGENIIRLSNLESLSLDKYKEDVLPKLINILLDSKDTLSQQYIVECIIHAFSEVFNINCIDILLDTITKLLPSVDIKSLFINLMEKLSKFIGEELKQGEGEEEYLEIRRKAQAEAESIFILLKTNIDKIVNENLQSSPTNELKIIELLVAFMKFALKSCPSHLRLEYVNNIISSALFTLKAASSNRLSSDCIKQVVRLLTLPLENNISIFTIPEFSNMMTFLDYSNKSNLALNILDSFAHHKEDKKGEYIDSIDKIKLVLNYLKPITEESVENEEIDKSQFNYEQVAVSKLVFFIREKNPRVYYEMLNLIQSVYVKGGSKRFIFTIPSLINVYISLIQCLFTAYANNSGINQNKSIYQTQYTDTFTYSLDNKSDLIIFAKGIYENIFSLIKDYLIPADYANKYAFILSLISSLNLCKELGLEEISNKTALLALDQITEGDKKLQLVILFTTNLYSINCLSEEDYVSIVKKVSSLADSFTKRAEQSQIMMVISNLYYHAYYKKNEEECKESLSKAAEYADYTMSISPQNGLILYIQLINKYTYYVEKGASSLIKSKKMNKLIDKINNCIKSIKAEHTSTDYLDEIEKFYSETLFVLKSRKISSTNEFYKELNIK